MKLVIPSFHQRDTDDDRVVRLAEFLGIPWEHLPLDVTYDQLISHLHRANRKSDLCLVVNPEVIGRWISDGAISETQLSALLSIFKTIFVHNLSCSTLSNDILRATSRGLIQSVCPPVHLSSHYTIASDCADICGPYSGLRLGPFDNIADHVLVTSYVGPDLTTIVSISEQPTLALLRAGGTEVYYYAGRTILDLDIVCDEATLPSLFPSLIPPMMALRRIFQAQCWNPHKLFASLIIDDPLLENKYGLLDYRELLELMDQHSFHTSIAFIPFNYRRGTPDVGYLFMARRDRYSICFHGNNHTAHEFASMDDEFLNESLCEAVNRMAEHERRTGIGCDRVMVFPQGAFSLAALSALAGHDFIAAINSGLQPIHEAIPITAADLIQPALLTIDGCPLYSRRYVREFSSDRLALYGYLGKPLFVVEHHDVFKDTACVTDLVDRINKLHPEVNWTSPQEAIRQSYLRRFDEDGTCHIRSYSSEGVIQNKSRTTLHCTVEWLAGPPDQLKGVRTDRGPCQEWTIADQVVRASFDVIPGATRTFSIHHHQSPSSSREYFGLMWNIKVLLRRMLSEFRDKYVSRWPRLLVVATSFQRRFLKMLN